MEIMYSREWYRKELTKKIKKEYQNISDSFSNFGSYYNGVSENYIKEGFKLAYEYLIDIFSDEPTAEAINVTSEVVNAETEVLTITAKLNRKTWKSMLWPKVVSWLNAEYEYDIEYRSCEINNNPTPVITFTVSGNNVWSRWPEEGSLFKIVDMDLNPLEMDKLLNLDNVLVEYFNKFALTYDVNDSYSMSLSELVE